MPGAHDSSFTRSHVKQYHVHHCEITEATHDWSAITPLTDFSFPWTDSPAPATSFRAALFDDTFHFRFEIQDQDIVLGDAPTTREKVLASDRAEIFFAADPNLASYYCLEIDPRGLVFDYHMRFYRQMDDAWSCLGLQITANILPHGYEITGHLPRQTLRDIGVRKPASNRIIAGLYRAEFSHAPDNSTIQDWISWIDPQTDHPDFHVPTSFGTLLLE
jgi:hypothetical protein